jgi:anti-sigma factor RsiW
MKKPVHKKRGSGRGQSKRTRCLAIFSRLSEYLDGELDAGRSAQINRHMKNCVNCCAFFNTFKKTVDLCRRSPRGRLSKRIRERLFERLETECRKP